MAVENEQAADPPKHGGTEVDADNLPMAEANEQAADPPKQGGKEVDTNESSMTDANEQAAVPSMQGGNKTNNEVVVKTEAAADDFELDASLAPREFFDGLQEHPSCEFIPKVPPSKLRMIVEKFASLDSPS